MHPPPIHRTIWNPLDEGVVGYWGAATASLDWCESNYEWTFFIAELINTISNGAFVALAVLGITKDIQQRLPKRYAIGHAGLIVIGLGSALFHATLLYSFQLGDELPMIIVSTIVTWMVFDISPISAPTAWGLPTFLVFFNIAFTWAYIYYPNPVFHQVCYGTLVAATTFRGAWLLFTFLLDTPENKAKNKEARKLQLWGSISFLFAFFLWNCDNLLCQHNVRLKTKVGVPLKFVLEGHAWWHIFTGLGVYYILASMSFMTACIRDRPENYCLKYELGFLPWVSRTEAGWAALGQKEPSERTALLLGE